MADSEPSGTVTCTVVGMTDVGKVREHNEDNFLVINSSEGRRFENGERVVFPIDTAMLMAVADGMGGAAAGEVASLMAVDRFAKDLGNPDFVGSTPDQLAAKIDQTLQAANNDIKTHADENPDRKGMGTTMTAAVVTPGQMFISQVGDSRGYLYRKGKLLRLTRDQSLIEQLIDEGTITEEEAERMGGRNIILQALGVEDTVRPDTKPFPVLRGDIYLLCSDGLSGMIKDEVMEQIVTDVGDDLVEGVQRLIQAANDNGGRDNITVVLARFEGDGLRAPMESVSQEDIEKTGVQFKAPPPPTIANPMKKLSIVGLAIMALLAVLLFTQGRSDAELQVSIFPDDVAVDLTLTNAESGQEIIRENVRGTATFPELPLGKWVLTGVEPKYFPHTVELEIREPGEIKRDIIFQPEPVESLKFTFNVDGATVRFKPADSGDWKEGVAETTTLEFNNVPAGKVELEVTREGFRMYTETLDLAPADPVSKSIDLVELQGTVTVACSEPGVAVQMLDRFGSELASGVTPADGPLVLENVRAGKRHELRASKDGFRKFTTDVNVVEGVTSPVDVALSRELRQVIFRSPKPFENGIVQRPGAEGEWEDVKGPTGKGVVVMVSDANGGPTFAVGLEPGDYRLTFTMLGKKRKLPFQVAAGSDEQFVEVPE